MSRHYYLTTQTLETTFSFREPLTMLFKIATIIETYSLSIALTSVSTVSVRSVCIRVLYIYPIYHVCVMNTALMGSLIASLMDLVPDGYILERLLDGCWLDGSLLDDPIAWWLLTWWQLAWWLYCLMTADLMAAELMALVLDGSLLDGSSAWWLLTWWLGGGGFAIYCKKRLLVCHWAGWFSVQSVLFWL